MDNQGLKWVTSSYSSSGNCVEIADHDHRVMVRDTKARASAAVQPGSVAQVRGPGEAVISA
jgi:hypothetical protein